MAKENQAAFENMKVNLLANRLVPEKVPLVLQYNKQDLPDLRRDELDRTLNPWGRTAFPAVAARGEGVMETFAAVVQEMLAAIAVKYNLKEKGLDPASVPEIVAQAFAEIVREAPPRSRLAGPASPAPKVVIAEPEGIEPAYPGQVGPEVNPGLGGAAQPRDPRERRARPDAQPAGSRGPRGARRDPDPVEPARRLERRCPSRVARGRDRASR